VLIDGEVVTGLPPRARKIAMVFQSYALYPHKMVLADIVFPLRATGMSREERERKAGWAADLLGIAALLSRNPGSSLVGSGSGSPWRGRWVRDPQVFLLDEPLSNVDAKLRASARDELKRFQHEVATTTIYVTHDQAEAMGLGDRIAILADGKVRQVGPAAEIYDDPADTFVATFLGSPPMDLVPRDGELVGFRPEHFLPVENVRSVELVETPLAVERIEYLSGDRHVYGSVSRISEDTRVVARLPATVDTPIAAGETHEFAVPDRRLGSSTPTAGGNAHRAGWRHDGDHQRTRRRAGEADRPSQIRRPGRLARVAVPAAQRRLHRRPHRSAVRSGDRLRGLRRESGRSFLRLHRAP
jgi:multiple sugar transport system ATP-binding protein